MEVMISPEVLGNFGVMSATVIAIVEALKRGIFLIRPKPIPNKVPVIIALVTSFGASFADVAFLSNWTVIGIFLAIGNAIAIFGAATAGYKGIKPKLKKLKGVI